MIIWEAEVITEPELQQKYTDEQLRSFEMKPLVLEIPSNSHHFERGFQLMASHASRSSNPRVRVGLCEAAVLKRKRQTSSVKRWTENLFRTSYSCIHIKEQCRKNGYIGQMRLGTGWNKSMLATKQRNTRLMRRTDKQTDGPTHPWTNQNSSSQD